MEKDIARGINERGGVVVTETVGGRRKLQLRGVHVPGPLLPDAALHRGALGMEGLDMGLERRYHPGWILVCHIRGIK